MNEHPSLQVKEEIKPKSTTILENQLKIGELQRKLKEKQRVQTGIIETIVVQAVKALADKLPHEDLKGQVTTMLSAVDRLVEMSEAEGQVNRELHELERDVLLQIQRKLNE